MTNIENINNVASCLYNSARAGNLKQAWAYIYIHCQKDWPVITKQYARMLHHRRNESLYAHWLYICSAKRELVKRVGRFLKTSNQRK